MSGITNKLISQFILIDKNIHNSEYDSLISTGEQCSSAIVCSILKKENKIKIIARLANSNINRFKF